MAGAQIDYCATARGLFGPGVYFGPVTFSICPGLDNTDKYGTQPIAFQDVYDLAPLVSVVNAACRCTMVP